MSIPYSYSIQEADESDEKVKEVKGVLSFADEELLFEYKVYDAYGNGISNLSKFAIRLDNLKRIAYKKGFLFTGEKLILEANQVAFFEPLPGSEEGKISLNIKRRDRNEAIRFSTTLNLYISQKRQDEEE